jgi:hypothetical protein
LRKGDPFSHPSGSSDGYFSAAQHHTLEYGCPENRQCRRTFIQTENIVAQLRTPVPSKLPTVVTDLSNPVLTRAAVESLQIRSFSNVTPFCDVCLVQFLVCCVCRCLSMCFFTKVAAGRPSPIRPLTRCSTPFTGWRACCQIFISCFLVPFYLRRPRGPHCRFSCQRADRCRMVALS